MEAPNFSISPLYWSDTELRHWLERRGLPQSICRSFEDHMVNGMVAIDLSEEDLRPVQAYINPYSSYIILILLGERRSSVQP